MDEPFFMLLAFAGWCLGIAGYVKARRALAAVEALRAQLASVLPLIPVSSAVVSPAATPPARSPWTTPPPQAAPQPPERRRPARPRLDIEALLTQRLGVWLGAVALLLAGVFLVRTAAEQGWLGPEVRCALAALLGAALIGAAEWLRRRPRPLHPAPTALAAGGTAALFSAAHATGALYGLVSPLAGLTLMAAAGLAGLALSLLHGPLVAVVGLVGAFATPLLVEAGPPSLPGLFGYLLLVTAASLLVMRLTAWTWLGWAACAGGAAWVVLAAGGGGDAWAPGLFVPAAAVLFLALLPGAALDRPAGRRFAWVPVLALAASGLVLTGLTADPAARTGLLLLAPATLGAAWREPRLIRAPWLAALVALLALLTWALPPWQATGETLIIEGGAVVLPGDWTPEAIRSFLTASAAMAALYAGVGLAGERRRAGRLAWAGFAAAVPVVLLAAAYTQVGRFQPNAAWAAAAALLAAGLVGAAHLARAGEDGVRRAGVHAAGAVAALALGCAVLLAEQWLTLAVALLLPPLAWIEARAELPPLRRVALAVGLLVLARLALNPFALGYEWGAAPVLNGLLPGYGVPAACFALAAHLFRRRADDAVVTVLETGAWALGTLLVVLEIRHWATAGGLLVESFGLLECGLYVSAFGVLALAAERLCARRSRPVLNGAARVLGALALLGGALLLLLNPLLTGQDAGPVPVLNALLPAYAIPAALAVATRRRGRLRSSYALAAIFAWASLSVRHAFYPGAMALWDAPVEDAELWAYSGAWLLLGAALLAWGLRVGRRPVRLAALALVGLASAKVFAVDMAGLDGLWRVLSFLGLGLALIGLSAAYRRVMGADRAAAQPP